MAQMTDSSTFAIMAAIQKMRNNGLIQLDPAQIASEAMKALGATEKDRCAHGFLAAAARAVLARHKVIKPANTQQEFDLQENYPTRQGDGYLPLAAITLDICIANLKVGNADLKTRSTHWRSFEAYTRLRFGDAEFEAAWKAAQT